MNLRKLLGWMLMFVLVSSTIFGYSVMTGLTIIQAFGFIGGIIAVMLLYVLALHLIDG